MMMKPFQQLWKDQAGFLATGDLILIGTILVLGMIVGLTSLRDQLVQEFGDVATAVGQLNQSYSFAAQTSNGFTVAGSSFQDNADACEEGTTEGSTNNDTAGEPPGCIVICEVEATPEG